MNHGSMERDETWVPLTRSEMNLPPADEKFDYEEYFGDTPLWTLGVLVVRQVIAFQCYLRSCSYLRHAVSGILMKSYSLQRLR